MKIKSTCTMVLMLAAIGLLTGCSGAATASEPTDVPVVADASAGAVVAEAVIEPARWEQLGFEMGGKVVDVLVVEGSAVQAGDPIARLETDDLDRALASADLSLRQAQLRLAQLEKPADE
ncbi:MAG: biotin/lipoyl-binding protein, partial [Anaerolineae bacterium]|nr:biotin/lipoyl-binding protein [Anaerolineae bacterium]